MTTFLYDLNGNRSEKKIGGSTVQTYAYDSDNRLVSLVDSVKGTFAYTYDQRTRRVGRDESSAGGASTELSFTGGLSVQEYPSGSDVSNVENIRGSDYGGGIGGVLYTIRSGARSFNSYNSRGDVVGKTDTTGTITWQASYEAFGTRTQEQGATEDRQKANTKDEDPTGLLNEGFRYRDLEFGVFLTRDPAGFADGPNVYTYVKQNPWSAFDSDGLLLGFIADACFAAYDTYEYSSGKIDGKEYAKRMALTATSVVANAASGGTAGLGVSVASVAARGSRVAKVAQVGVKAAVAVDKANEAYEKVTAVAESGQQIATAVQEGDARGVVKAVVTGAIESAAGKKVDETLGAMGSQRKVKGENLGTVQQARLPQDVIGPLSEDRVQ